MAQRTEIRLTDDLTGNDIPPGRGETVTFGLDGHDFEIDLTTKNAMGLRKTLEAYVDAGRKISPNGHRGGRRKPSPKTTRTTVDSDPRTIKEWARANGYEVNDRGRIPGAIQDAFREAQRANHS